MAESNSPDRPRIQTRRSTTSVFTLTPGEAEQYVNSYQCEENLSDSVQHAFDQKIYAGGEVSYTNNGDNEEASPKKKKKSKKKRQKRESKLDSTELKYFRELSNIAGTSPNSLPEAPVYTAPGENTQETPIEIDSPNWALSTLPKGLGYTSPLEIRNTPKEKDLANWAVTLINQSENNAVEEVKYKRPSPEPDTPFKPKEVVRRSTTVSVISLSPKIEEDFSRRADSEPEEDVKDDASTKNAPKAVVSWDQLPRTEANQASATTASTPVVSPKKSKKTVAKDQTTKREENADNKAKKKETKDNISKEDTNASTLPGPSEVTGATQASGSSNENATEENTDTCCKGTPCAPLCARLPARVRKPGGPFPAIWGCMKATPGKVKETVMERKWLFAVIIGVFLLFMFLILFPISFVYVPYYEIALLRTISTGKIHRDQTYYPGCYVKGPNAEFVYSQQSAHIISLTLSVFTFDRLELNVSISYSYFIRPEELGQLDARYGQGYGAIFENIATATVKNEFIRFKLDELLQERAKVEKELHLILFKKLGGTCCLRCCVKEGCVGSYLNHLCTNCDASSSCDPGHHIEVKYFQLGLVEVPSSIAESLLRNVVLNEQSETASLLKQAEIVSLETERQVKVVTNQAREIDGAAAATSSRITSFADADSDVITQDATFTGWKSMASTLSLTSQDHKLSLLLINKLSKMDNLVLSNGYNSSTKYHRP